MSPELPFPGMDSVPRVTRIVPGSTLETWISIFGPAGLPTPMVPRLNRAVDTALKDAEFEKAVPSINQDTGELGAGSILLVSLGYLRLDYGTRNI